MAEPEIIRDRTWVWFRDAAGVEWQVVDASRRGGQRWWKEHAGTDWAERRYFVRYSEIDGSKPRRAIDVRRYDFRRDESRWFVAELWQSQLERSAVRQPRDTGEAE